MSPLKNFFVASPVGRASVWPWVFVFGFLSSQFGIGSNADSGADSSANSDARSDADPDAQSINHDRLAEGDDYGAQAFDAFDFDTESDMAQLSADGSLPHGSEHLAALEMGFGTDTGIDVYTGMPDNGPPTAFDNSDDLSAFELE